MQWLMLQQEFPEDYVIATGRQESVRNFIDLSAKELGWGKLIWEGEGIDEVGKRINGDIVIKIDKRFFRPTEVNSLLGDAS
jgi:GDPmannose 4,6-dehydratase